MSRIPDTPTGFCGRDEELQLLCDHSASGGVMIITGMPGMGKTVLAAELARELHKGAFADTVAWLSCKPGWNDMDFLSSVQNAIAQCSGLKKYQLIKPEPALLAEAVQECSIALFVDDFHLVESQDTISFISLCREQLSGALLVIVTRKKPALPPVTLAEIFHHQIRGLSAGDSRELIRTIFQAQRSKISPETPELCRLLEGHPYALKLAAGLILSGQFTCAELEKSASGLTEQLNEHLMSRMCDSLTAEAGEILNHLSLLRVPVSNALLESFLSRSCRTDLRLLHDHC
ncbi:MAG: NB-ARC domain-containing protein, partial [Candidatus Wallbacteria bacterium]|nr:NB-ARC domain-containing protein [Candidatus Wallbacteria bacterium]